MNIEVVICAHNEAAFVARVLASLKAQSVGSSNFRVIFVDNASADETSGAVQTNAVGLDLLYIREDRLGKNFACNAGMAAAKSEFVAFLDADAMAHSRWIEEVLRVLDERDPDLCGGPYFPYYIAPKPAWFLDRYNSNYMGDTARYLAQEEYLSGTNMIWRRSLLEKLGGFKGGVGLAGRGLARGDETELILRARQVEPEFKAYYDPHIIVQHVTRPETYSLWYWARRHYAHGRHWKLVIDPDRPQAPAARARQLARCLATITRLVLGLTSGRVIRDRSRYPHFENLVYERLLPELWTVGTVSAWLLPNRDQARAG